MPESIYITRHEFNSFMKNMNYLVENLRAQISNKKPAPWITPDEAMEMIGCKETKLKTLRKAGEIDFKTSGAGRNIRFDRKSIEQYIERNSTHMRIA